MVVLQRIMVAVLALAVLGGGAWLLVRDDLKSSEESFDIGPEHYRVRITGSAGHECVRLEQENRRSRQIGWAERGRDCAWPRIGASGVPVAGGQAEELSDGAPSNPVTPPSASEWLFYGIVPDTAAEVVLTPAGGEPMRIATRAADHAGSNRIYLHRQTGPRAGFTIIGLQLYDATGGEIRVY